MIDMHPPPRILAIEPDPQSGTALYLALDKWVCADVLIVDNIDAALTSIAEQVPDLILTSTFLPPATLARLNDELRRLPDATHTLIITTPHLLDDAVLLGAQVEHYLAQARSLHEAAQARQQRGLVPSTDLVLVARPPDPWQDSIGSPALRIPTAQDLRALNSLRPADRRRASRRRAADLAGQWGLRLSPGGDARIVDISCSGVRLETSTRLQPGSLIDLEVIGMEGSIAVGARLIRTEAVEADGADVKYRAAAMFLREIDLFAQNANPMVAAAASHTPRTLADLLTRVLADAKWLSNGRRLWSLFESEVCALVTAKEVRIRALPVAAAGGCQSLYFRIPTAAESEHGLHVVFERGYRPTAAEFRLLKAAASLASVVLDLAPADEAPSIN
jgi:CheY-like chemotaxis protein